MQRSVDYSWCKIGWATSIFVTRNKGYVAVSIGYTQNNSWPPINTSGRSHKPFHLNDYGHRPTSFTCHTVHCSKESEKRGVVDGPKDLLVSEGKGSSEMQIVWWGKGSDHDECKLQHFKGATVSGAKGVLEPKQENIGGSWKQVAALGKGKLVGP